MLRPPRTSSQAAAPPVVACSRRVRARGTTLIELMVVMSVMLVAVSIFYQMVISTNRLRVLNHENAVAIEAARAVVEQLRNEEFDEVWALYNPDPSDDPGGAGSAPGHRFVVADLDPLESALDGCIGEIVFPSELVEIGGGAGVGKIGGALPGLGGVGGISISQWQLREDFVDDELGMPRDLDGDSVIDNGNHARNYLILPVRIRLQWQGVFGPRTMDLHTMIGEFRRS